MQHNNNRWSPSSWRQLATKHQPSYRDKNHLSEVLEKIRNLPPLVSPESVDLLSSQLKLAQAGKAMILQAGDCAESFDHCTERTICSQLSLIDDLGEQIARRNGKPTIKIGRIAGQYAKPRSAAFELISRQEVPVFLGDNINSINPQKRSPNPELLLEAYKLSQATLKIMAACLQQCSNNESKHFGQNRSKIFTSHEALLLPLEEANTHYVPELQGWYNLSAHMLWIGDRTRGLNEGHIEYARGIRNPIGVKVGPSANANELMAIIERLNPENAPGKISLITRFGWQNTQAVAGFISAVQDRRLKVLWLSDPMHGNTQVLANGIKTRRVEDITREIQTCESIHAALGSSQNGLHLETSGDPITECIGGTAELSETDLSRNYQSKCDPRLNRSQARDVALAFAEATAATNANLSTKNIFSIYPQRQTFEANK